MHESGNAFPRRLKFHICATAFPWGKPKKWTNFSVLLRKILHGKWKKFRGNGFPWIMNLFFLRKWFVMAPHKHVLKVQILRCLLNFQKPNTRSNTRLETIISRQHILNSSQSYSGNCWRISMAKVYRLSNRNSIICYDKLYFIPYSNLKHSRKSLETEVFQLLLSLRFQGRTITD